MLFAEKVGYFLTFASLFSLEHAVFMRNKLGVISLTVVISLLCVYYLSFSLLTKRVERRAEQVAKQSDGSLDFRQKQAYLDSVWNEPVLHFLGASFTYKELKETELNLGLDLQGGMHVTLEVFPVPLLVGLSGNSQDSTFLYALQKAQERAKAETQQNFLSLFRGAFREKSPEKPLAQVFAHVGNRRTIAPTDPDEKVMSVLQSELDQAIDRSFHILRARLDRFGTSQPNIQRLQGSQRIQIELPGVDNPARVRKLLQGVAKLEFWEVYGLNEIESNLVAINDLLLKKDSAQAETKTLSEELSEDVEPEDEEEIEDETDDSLADLFEDEKEGSAKDSLLSGEKGGSAKDSLLLAEEDSLAEDSLLLAKKDSLSTEEESAKASPIFSLLRSNQGLVYEVKDTLRLNRLLQRSEVKALLPPYVKLLWGVKPVETDEGLELLELYAIRSDRQNKAPLVGDVIRDARQDLDQYSRPSVSMQMNTKGAKIWRKLTRENIDKQVAIVLDNRVYSAPVVQGEIPNGNSQITGNFSLEEAKDLANILKSGALPVPVRIVEDVVVGPTLGKIAQRQGLISILSGLCMVVLFMMAYYARGGAVADIALAFNVFFILGILTQLNTALTLPGIAGIVLTIGMSVDANVLIFERIREEMRQGVGLRKAIDMGYAKAYSSIIDGNATTFLTALVLYIFGQGPLKGFAITLMIGILCSFFSAIFITRLIITWVVQRKEATSGINFETAWSKRWFGKFNFAFIQARKKAYLLSSLVIVLGIGSFFLKGGLNMGVDFLGGRSYVVEFSKSYNPSDIQIGLLPYLDEKSVEVKTYGRENVLKITTNYLVGEVSEEGDKQVRGHLVEGLREITGLVYKEGSKGASEGEFSIVSSVKVGPTIAQDIKDASLTSLILSLMVVFLYILLRFRRWQFGLGAIVALFHDVFFVLSIVSMLHLFGIGLEINQVFIAAMLTLIGYSINDTVIIFDRVRENLRLRPREENTSLFNDALNKTLSRTLITSATTLFVVIVLLLFGGVVLSNFSFTLLVGILIGTYSSVFIAVPVTIDSQRWVKEKVRK